MDPLHRAKQDYNQINIPNDLDQLVDQSIRQGKAFHHKATMNKGFKLAFTACCGLILFYFPNAYASVNRNETGSGIVRSWSLSSKENSLSVSANVPFILNDENDGFSDEINREIFEIIDNRIQLVKEAALESYTLAKAKAVPEEIEEAEHDLYIDYSIKYESENTVSFVITIEDAYLSVEHFNYYTTINIQDKKDLTLMDLIQEEQLELINQEIKNQIQQREKEDENNCFFHDESEFKSIDENQSFYINENKQLVIVFERCEIAPNYMGEVEFIMPFEIPIN